ncbi:uncharacterized protein LOC141591606 [Silene latifolia]|uniref:uncharacterized protein LOC141591606 n=1 Tax=Silene latifolia TaxID=37657 RepID=UPI003D7874D6
MRRREKPRAKPLFDEEEEEDEEYSKSKSKSKKNRRVFDSDSDSDDEAANEDLTLKIIEKAMSRASNSVKSTDVNGDSSVTAGEEVVVHEVVSSEGEKKKKKVKKVKKKKQKVAADSAAADDFIPLVPTTPVVELEHMSKDTTKTVEELVDMSKDSMVVNLSDSNAAENSNSENAVLRRLLRGPRYFDPPDKSWGSCFNCGEEGHTAVNCTSARRKKPCFVCGSLEHEVKQCQKGQDCFICKGQGHRAKDCPQKMKRCSSASDFCLKCGSTAHVMHLCNNDYSPDDLKDIQCYVCKRFGHLCCANYFDILASEDSCYKCGHTGHNGQDCRGGSKGETSASGTPSSCFKCGEEGHFARECKTSGKAKKRARDSTPAGKKYPKDKKANKAHKSAFQDFGKTRRKHLYLDEESPNWSSKPKRRGGWTPDDPYDSPPRNGWKSPWTPNKNHRIFDLTAGGQGSSHRPFRNKSSNYSPGSSSRGGYGSSYEHRYTASRFGHPTQHTDSRRNYNWW